MAYGILHGAAADRRASWREAAVSISLGENLEEFHGVFDLAKEWIEGQVCAETDPKVPSGCGGAGSCRSDAMFDGFLYKADITAEFIGCSGIQRRQDVCCG